MSEAIPKLLALREVADCCRVSPHTVRSWVRQGRLKPLRICRRLLFHPDEVARFLAEAK
jgi:excisionase family DNA binding protein